jgi:hypothetical protein
MSAEGASATIETAFVVELDGCDIRTGVFMSAADAGFTQRAPDELVRPIQWQEVRTGLVRPLDENVIDHG